MGRSAAFFDLDKTLMSGSSGMQFARVAARQGIVSRLSDDLRRSLTKVFASIRKKAPRVPAELDHQLLAGVQEALDQLAVEEERVSSSP